ncbi:MAG: acetyltransferase [Thermodesulfobacteriota bacterium]|jgi:sugar O-acyltransferase (sialic acid O-acetyltransferase NeuD family)
MSKVVIFGSEKLSELAYFYLTNDSPYEVAAFTVNEEFLKDKRFVGLPIVPFEEIERLYPPDKFKMFIAIGYKKLNTIRASKYEEAKSKGYQLISYVSSKAIHWGDTEIGDNCFILENQVIQPFVRIGNDVVLWSGNHFGHNVVIGDHCWISSHVVISGGVSIGPYSFIGVNATIRDNVSIGRECIIGAGAIMLKDAKDREVYIAKPTELYRLDSTSFERMMDISK